VALSTKRRSSKRMFGKVYAWEDNITGKPEDVKLPIRNIATADYGPTACPFPEFQPTEMQVTASENHPAWRRRSQSFLFRGDIGGEFSMERTYVTPEKVPSVLLQGNYTSGLNRLRYSRVGPILPCEQNLLGFPASTGLASSNAVLDAWGAKAVSLCKPTNSVADVATMLGEVLREGLPKMIGHAFWKDETKKSLRKKGSSEFLNYQFGLSPMVREIRAVALAIANADAVLRQYQRDSGKMVRRRFEFPPEETSSVSVLKDPASPILSSPSHSALFQGSSHKGKSLRISRTVRRRWFAGAFTYYLPRSDNAMDSMYGQALLARKLLGLSLTPDVLWNLAPWSWAVDWFTNAGDVISNLTSWQVDGLVMRYGYMMEHVVSTHEYVFTGGTSLRSAHRPPAITFVREIKRRRKANPFGFGITWSGLSPVQLAIAAALGLNRGK